MKAAGPDDLKPIILQNLDSRSITELTIIYKVCLTLSYVPKDWCGSNVIFIPKPGKESYDNPKSYRPVSLTPFGQKILERLIAWELEEKQLIKTHELQYAFRKNRSTNIALKWFCTCMNSLVHIKSTLRYKACDTIITFKRLFACMSPFMDE